MIYAINKTTKEHVDVSDMLMPHVAKYADSCGWELRQADADGWIEWKGGECPLPYGRECGVKHRDGNVFDNTFAGSVVAFGWGHTSDDGDIIAYRPVLDENSKPEATEWDGVAIFVRGGRIVGVNISKGFQNGTIRISGAEIEIQEE